MANWCSVIMNIDCVNDEEAEKLYNNLSEHIDSADEEGIAAFFGSDDRFIFGGQVELWDSTVYLTGEVKWCVNSKEMLDIAKYCKGQADIENITLEYEELGFKLYGVYEYNGKTLTCASLPEEYITDELYDSDELAEDLESLFEKYREVEIIAEDV